MTPTIKIISGGIHIVTGPGNMCECGIDEKGHARGCAEIVDDLVRRGVHEYLDGKTPKENIMNTVRCKAVCTQVEQHKDSGGKVYQESANFCGVYSSDPASENKWFCQWTPSFSVGLSIDNPNAFGTFKEGKEYYVDFQPVPDKVPAPVTESPVPTAEVELPLGSAASAPISGQAGSTCDQEAKAEAQPEALAPAPVETQLPTGETPPPAS